MERGGESAGGVGRRSGPPGLVAGAEVGLRPFTDEDVVVFNADVGECQGERGWAANNLAGGVVLTAMARTHKFVGATVPRHHATQVGADGIDSVTADGVSTFNNQVSGITFEALNQAGGRLLDGWRAIHWR